MELDRTEDERILVERILAGNVKDFEIIIKKYKKLIGHIVFRMITSPEDREDICQEAFMKMYANLRNFKFTSKFSTWAAAIAYNTAVNYLQKRKESLFGDLSNEKVSEIEARERRPDELLESRDRRELINKELNRLPPAYRAVVTLYHLEEMNYAEIARITNMPEGTVKSHLFRARRILKSRLESIYRRETLCKNGI
jgi:RNA polymerase sigma-70 factor (ECF subfamily)